MYCFVEIDCYLPSSGRARMNLSSPKSLMLSWSVSSRKKYPCLTARWTSKQRPRHASSTRSDRMSWARPWQGRKQGDTVMQQSSHLMCICKASEKTLELHSTLPPACCCPGRTLKPPPFSFASTTRWAVTAVVMLQRKRHRPKQGCSRRGRHSVNNIVITHQLGKSIVQHWMMQLLTTR